MVLKTTKLLNEMMKKRVPQGSLVYEVIDIRDENKSSMALAGQKCVKLNLTKMMMTSKEKAIYTVKISNDNNIRKYVIIVSIYLFLYIYKEVCVFRFFKVLLINCPVHIISFLSRQHTFLSICLHKSIICSMYTCKLHIGHLA